MGDVVHVKRARFDVYIGRPSRHIPEPLWDRWGNPFTVRRHSRANALRLYNAWIMADAQTALRAAARRLLRGKIVGCWCAGEDGLWHYETPVICHGQILLRIAASESDAELLAATSASKNDQQQQCDLFATE